MPSTENSNKSLKIWAEKLGKAKWGLKMGQNTVRQIHFGAILGVEP
jgi:hypothetical protein